MSTVLQKQIKVCRDREPYVPTHPDVDPPKGKRRSRRAEVSALAEIPQHNFRIE